MRDESLIIGMVAGEASGDNLGAALVREILDIHPDTRFVGVGGPAMTAEGFTADADIERLSVNGIVDPLLRLPSLLKLLLDVRDRAIDQRVDCFVGIDFNFFNLLLAGMLRKRGIKTVQYVSPTVWAWRQGRIGKIAKSVDLMMTLYPFETDIYERNNIGVVFVGHPKADEIALDEGEKGRGAARRSFGCGENDRIIAILPGSRASEVKLSGADFLATAALLEGEVDRFLIPAANQKRKLQLERMIAELGPALREKLTVVTGDARRVMTAADVVLVNSGTATLEAMLLRRPMVMSYRFGALSYAVISRLVKTSRFALPNILANEDLVPEFIQDDAKPIEMARAVRELLNRSDHSALLKEFDRIHRELRKNEAPGREAARAVLNLIGVGSVPA